MRIYETNWINNSAKSALIGVGLSSQSDEERRRRCLRLLLNYEESAVPKYLCLPRLAAFNLLALGFLGILANLVGGVGSTPSTRLRHVHLTRWQDVESRMLCPRTDFVRRHNLDQAPRIDPEPGMR